MPLSRLLVPVVAAIVVVAGCGDDPDDSPAASAPTTTPTEAPAEAIDADRCQANRDAGTITFLTGFDFAATASGIEFMVADERGYFEDLCLDVEIRPSFSTQNVPLVAAGTAQFASIGSYTELVRSQPSGAHLVAVLVEGKTPIEALVVPAEGPVMSLADLKGKTIGVKGAMPPTLQAMLRGAGLAEGDYREVLLDGFDPVAHLAQPIDALPVYKSNEPGILEHAGVAVRTFDPATFGIPGTFGVVYTSADFLADHPTAAEDTVRAALHGLQDAIADPEAAVDIAVARLAAGASLTEDGERFRWRIESDMVASSTPAGEIPGLIDPDVLEAVIDAHTEAGVFATRPDTAGTYDAELARRLLNPDGTLAWPA